MSALAGRFRQISNKVINDFKRYYEKRICNDVVVGTYTTNGAISLNFCPKTRRALYKNSYQDKLSCPLDWEPECYDATIVVVLESPHKLEYSQDFVSPAMGATGQNLCKMFPCVLNVCSKHLRKGFVYRVILMNAIQYQCSLGKPTKSEGSNTSFRDRIFPKMWGYDKTKKNFQKRLKNYDPEVVFNFCTQGKDKKSSFRKIVQEEIIHTFAEQRVQRKIFLFRHPAAWTYLGINSKDKDKIIENLSVETKTSDRTFKIMEIKWSNNKQE